MFPFMMRFELPGPGGPERLYLHDPRIRVRVHRRSVVLVLHAARDLARHPLSIRALLLEKISCHTCRRPGNLFKLICMAIAENFGYHQLVLVWRLEGFYQWVTSAPAKWGVMKRSGSLQETRR
jgi:hypothetical protein